MNYEINFGIVLLRQAANFTERLSKSDLVTKELQHALAKITLEMRNIVYKLKEDLV